jgi:hypothetical protein
MRVRRMLGFRNHTLGLYVVLSVLPFSSMYLRAVQYRLSRIYRNTAEEEHQIKPLAKRSSNKNCSGSEAAHSLY